MTDGISGIQNRILEIERMLGLQKSRAASTQPAGNPASTGGAAPQSGAEFSGILQRVTSTVANADLSKYANGRIPDSALVSIGKGDKLAAPAAKSFLQMQADAKSAGVNLPINDSYRSYDEQVEMARTKGLYGKGGLAAKPGTSDHGRGLSLDIEINSSNRAWMQANAGKYGFVNDVKGEPWHWTFKAGTGSQVSVHRH